MTTESFDISIDTRERLVIATRGEIQNLAAMSEIFSAVITVSNQALTILECRAIASLYRTGCRLFMFVGPNSEETHDMFDSVLDQQDLADVALTTFHVSEPPEDTVSLLLNTFRDSPNALVLFIDDDKDLSKGLIVAIDDLVQDEKRTT
jgi:hypothetical protein